LSSRKKSWNALGGLQEKSRIALKTQARSMKKSWRFLFLVLILKKNRLCCELLWG